MHMEAVVMGMLTEGGQQVLNVLGLEKGEGQENRKGGEGYNGWCGVKE